MEGGNQRTGSPIRVIFQSATVHHWANCWREALRSCEGTILVPHSFKKLVCSLSMLSCQDMDPKVRVDQEGEPQRLVIS